MSKKFGKFLLFSAMAGAAAYGVYSYMQKKEQETSFAGVDDTDDDFDDFSEDLDEEPVPTKVRSYVSLNLDKAEAIATEAFHKAKEVITDSVNQVRETVKSVTDSQSASETNFTDLTALQKRQKNRLIPKPWQAKTRPKRPHRRKRRQMRPPPKRPAPSSPRKIPLKRQIHQKKKPLPPDR